MVAAVSLSLGMICLLSWPFNDNFKSQNKALFLFFRRYKIKQDITFDVFQEENNWLPWERNLVNKTQKARNLKGMLKTCADGKPKGKIVVTYISMNDRALGSSSNVGNRGIASNRLGCTSAGGYYSRSGWPWQHEWKRDDNKILDEFKDCIESVNLIDFLENYESAHGHHLGNKEMAQRLYDRKMLQDW